MKRKNSILLIVLTVLLIIDAFILFTYNRFHIVSTYTSIFENYVIEEGYCLKEGDWHFNRLFRVRSNSVTN